MRLSNQASHVEMVVQDTGAGIDATFLPHVFERFRQGDSSTTRAHGGLGLGLAIVRHIVELHGGMVEARSDGRGQGATFAVKLPAIPVEPAFQPLPELAAEVPHPTAADPSRPAPGAG
jgi:signal transduction histidine kinase